MALQVTLSEEKDIVIIQLAGRIDSFVIDELNTGFDRAMKTGKKNVLLILKDLEYINSRGIGALMSFLKWVKRVGGLAKIAEVPLNIMQVLNLLGLDGLTLLYETKADAVESFGRSLPRQEEPEPEQAPRDRIPPGPPPPAGRRPLPVIALVVGCAVLLGLVVFLLLWRPGTRADKDLEPLQSRLETLEQRMKRLEGRGKDLTKLEGQIQGLRGDLKGRMDRLETMVDQLGKGLAEVQQEGQQKPVASEGAGTAQVPRYHVVRSGESLYRVGRRYGISVEELCRLNNIGSRRVIHPGQRLIVGFTGSPSTPASTSR